MATWNRVASRQCYHSLSDEGIEYLSVYKRIAAWAQRGFSIIMMMIMMIEERDIYIHQLSYPIEREEIVCLQDFSALYNNIKLNSC